MRALSLALLTLMAFGCARPIEAELLDVREVSPERIQPGHRLLVHGTGFPTGREARVHFEGVLHRPGLAPRAIELDVEGEAIADDRVEVAMPAAVLERFGGRGTFRGTVRVAFGADALDGGRVIGSLHGVAIDLLPHDATPLSSDSTFAPRIGLALAPREDDVAGVRIERVVPGSRAAEAGLVEGDRVLAIGGLRVLSRDEVAPPEGATSIELEVTRDGEARPFVVGLGLDGLDENVPTASILIAQLAALVWIGALVLLGPGAALLDRLAPGSRRVPWPLVIAALASTLAIRAALGAAPFLGLDAVWLAMIAGRSAIMLLGARDTRGRIDALVRAIASGIAIAGALAAATIAAGTTDLAALEAAQGPWPSDWIALRSPSGPLAALLIALAAACGPRISETQPRARALDDAFLIGLATCATVALAGGLAAHTAIGDVRPGLAWLGAAAFAGISTLATLLLRRARDHGARTPAFVLLALSLVAATLATVGALGWIELEVPRMIERAIAEVLVAAAVLVALRLATARPVEPSRPLHALL